MSLRNQIQSEIEAFEIENIELVPGLYFNQYETIKRIYFYYNSKYETGDIDSDGDKKYFFNIVKNPCKVVTKAIDFDTKNINIHSASGSDPLKAWYFERGLKQWMKDKELGKVLNRIFLELPILGSVIIKFIKGVPYFVDLRNFYLETAADTLNRSNYLIEKHVYTPMEFRKMAKNMVWDNVDEVFNDFEQMEDATHIVVYERYGEWDNKYQVVYWADAGIDKYDEKNKVKIPYQGILLKQKEITKHPYFEFHLEKIAGRWLGLGTVETLFDNQIRENELVNQEAKVTYWASLLLFHSPDEDININLNTESVQGQVFSSEGGINRIDMGIQNLGYFQEQTRKWIENRDEQTFSYDVVQGERLPSGTPLGSARLAAAMASSYFDQIRENVALDIKNFLYNAVIPWFKKENSIEHVLRIAGEDLDTVRTLIIKEKAFKELFNFIFKKGKLPTSQQYEMIKIVIKEKVNQGKEQLIKMPDNYYYDLKFKIDIIITGESKDTSIWAQTLFAALQAITIDPTLLSNPTKKKFFFRWLEAGGVSPGDFQVDVERPVSEQLLEGMPMPKGGGVSRPSLPVAPSQAPAETRL